MDKMKVFKDISLKFVIYIIFLLIGSILGGIYGIFHDQLTYTISSEYYTKFKYLQFNVIPTAGRGGAIFVGIMATWWMGLIIGAILGLVGFIHKNFRMMFKYVFESMVLTMATAFFIGMAGLIYGFIYLGTKQPEYFTGWFIPQGLTQFKNFIAVGSMHNFSYIGGVVGLIVGIAWQIGIKTGAIKSKGDKKILADIKKYGWHVVLVMADDKGPGFAFSIGIYRNYGQPEIVMFGLRSDVMHWAINEYGNQVKNGKKFERNVKYDGFLDESKCIFIEVSKKNYGDYLGSALWYYKNYEFPVLQCVWPSKISGLYPWDKEVAKEVIDNQPILNI